MSTKQSLRAIARHLDRAPSTISREVSRNGGRVAYHATVSDQVAWNRLYAPRYISWLATRLWPAQYLVKLQRKWSPEQIAG